MKYNKSEISLKEDVVEQEDKECLKAIIKGLFLGSGSINNPENKYLHCPQMYKALPVLCR